MFWRVNETWYSERMQGTKGKESDNGNRMATCRRCKTPYSEVSESKRTSLEQGTKNEVLGRLEAGAHNLFE